MADNLSVTAGSGSTIGMDEVTDGTLGTVKVGFGKIMDGTLDGTDKLKITTENAAQVAGDIAHDTADAGNPVKIGGKARSSAPADVSASGDRVDAYFDMKGRLKVDGSDVTQPVSASSLPLPTGASTSANQTTIIGHLDGVEGLLATIDTDTGTLAGAVSGTEMQVDIVTSALPTGASTSANQSTIIGHLDGVEGLLTTIDADTGNLPTIETNTDFGTVTGGGTETGALRVTIANNSTGVLSVDDNGSTLSVDDGGASLTVDGTVTANLAAGTNNIGDVDVLTINGQAPAFGTGTRSASTQRVTIATDDVVPASQSGTWTVQPGNTANTTPWLVKQQRSSTATVSSVNDTATSTTVLASNANRLHATVYNDSSALLYLLMGTGTASSTNYTVRIYSNGYYEVPEWFTGQLTGVWATDPNDGAARVTEYTA